MKGRSIPGDLLLHPVAVVALVVLLVNDHYLKAIAPGTATGKISDVAGLVLFPLLVLAVIEVARRGPAPGAVVAAVIATTAVVFAVVKLSPSAADVYSQALGVLAWPVHGAGAALGGRSAPSVVPIRVLADPTDLVALPALLVAYAVGNRRPETSPTVA